MYKCVNGHLFHTPRYFGKCDQEFSYDHEGCPRCRSPDYIDIGENRHDGKEHNIGSECKKDPQPGAQP